MAIISLTTDFGLSDPYVAAMKGVILSIAPEVRIVDLTHEIPPQDIEEAAYALQAATPYFPAGAVHLAVVDPGVGSARRPLLVTTPKAAFVGPDNGLFSFALRSPGSEAWELNRAEHWLPSPSRTFHGRDIFAPVAARLALGMEPHRLGLRISDPVLLPMRTPARSGTGEITGYVIHVDRFGNLITNIPGSWLAGSQWMCEVGGTRIAGLSETYAAVDRGALLLLVSSNDTLEIAVREGSAAERLRVRSGAHVRLWSS